MTTTPKRVMLGLMAVLALSAGCYYTGGMSVPTRDFFENNPKFSMGEEPTPEQVKLEAQKDPPGLNAAGDWK